MFNRILYRTRQFLHIISSRYTKNDQAFARKYLTLEEMALFSKLPVFEQKHSVKTAKSMLRYIHGKNLDERKVAKIGLLHDIGKSLIRLSVLDKILMVVIRAFKEDWYDYLAKMGESEKSPKFFRRFFVHKHHDALGEKLLSNLPVDKEVAHIVGRHTAKPHKDDAFLLNLLKKADTEY